MWICTENDTLSKYGQWTASIRGKQVISANVYYYYYYYYNYYYHLLSVHKNFIIPEEQSYEI